MKNLTLSKCLLFLIIGIGIISCSDDKDESEKNAELRLKADKTTITPFEKLTVSIDVDLELLYNSYDSVVWKNNGIWWNGIITIPNDDDERDLYITDYRLGKNKVYAIGYKDGIIKSSAEIEYNVEKPTKDFFTLNWGEAEEQNSNYYMTQRPVKTDGNRLKWEGIDLQVIHFSKNIAHEYSVLDFCPHSYSIHMSSQALKTKAANNSLPDIDNYDFFYAIDNHDPQKREEAHQMTRSFWHQYITMIYGESIFRYEGEDVRETTLWDEYNKRFKNPLDTNTYPKSNGKYPVEIWETPSSGICLFSLYTGWYYVIAEPRY